MASTAVTGRIAEWLQAIGYHATLAFPLLPMYLHLIVSALFPIYTGAHASLSRPSSAAKPPKRKKASKPGELDEPTSEPKMEGLQPMDAIFFPVMAGLTLAGLYCVIKWLDDPAIISVILNWYFAIFGLLSLARLLTDSMGVAMSYVFPDSYTLGGNVWHVDAKDRRVKPASSDSKDCILSPLPGYLARVPLPSSLRQSLWTMRELPSRKLQITAYIHKQLQMNVKVGPQGLSSLVLALVLELYFNLVDKPWWLTNLFGFSFAYSALQLMSPTTAWTGTLILGALFVYDIYFVFYTPLMVTVATSLDIPAKLLFPRPGDKRLSMLGLGDVVLPGMIIGFALRFDLYLFYLQKQMKQPKDSGSRQLASAAQAKKAEASKPEWVPAVGGWGERFWISQARQDGFSLKQGGRFPKRYFHATITGYIIGMLVTLGIMQIFGHAQPALLYLVPGVLGSLWLTALFKGEIKTLWTFSEAAEDDEEAAKKKRQQEKENAGGATTKASEQDKGSWMDLFLFGRLSKKLDEAEKEREKGKHIDVGAANGTADSKADGSMQGKDQKDAEINESKGEKPSAKPWDGRLISFSISLPQSGEDRVTPA